MSTNFRFTIRKSPSIAGDHPHHWLIEEAHGPESAGRCKLCGLVRELKNWLPEGDVTTRTERALVA